MSHFKSSCSGIFPVVQAVLRELLSFNLGEKIARQNMTGQAQSNRYQFGSVWISVKHESLWLLTELQTAEP